VGIPVLAIIVLWISTPVIFVLYTVVTLAFVTTLVFALVALAWTLVAFPFRVGWGASPRRRTPTCGCTRARRAP